MSIVYRAHSPSRNQGGTPTYELAYAAGDAAIRNQGCLTLPGALPDWTIQTGTVQWT